MAVANGFRVFIVEAFPTKTKGTTPYNGSRDSAVRVEIEQLLRRLVESGTQRFEPRPDDEGKITRPVKTATVKSVTSISPDHLHAVISVGETGSHGWATKPEAEDLDLRDRSPEVEHRVDFVFPTAKGSRFFLVTQTVHRRDPHLRLVSMLWKESVKLRDERRAADKEVRKVARKAGEEVGPQPKFERLAFDVHQASDNSYLDEILSGADAASVVFKSKALDAKGHTEYVDRVLQIKLRGHNILDVGRAVSRSWAQQWRDGNTPSQKDAVSEVSDLLIEQDLFEKDEAPRYESAAITVRSKSEASTTIAVDTLRDAFTYPVSDIGPDDYTFYDRVSSRLLTIAQQEEVPVEGIDPHEVSRCLTDSAPEVSSEES